MVGNGIVIKWINGNC